MRVVTLVLILSAAPMAVNAQQRTPWGDPDLQGIWSNQTPIPLERPPALAGKATFTEAEAAEVERTSLQEILKTLSRAVPLSGELNEVWLETQKGEVGPGRHTSLVIDPPDGRIPFTPEGRIRWDATPSIEGQVSGRPMAANGPEDRPLDERCISTGGLYVPNPFYNNYHQIVQARGYVAILTEMMHEMRIIPLDGRSPLGPKIRGWHGYSRGRWEGHTLVVETTNFNEKRLFEGATSQLRLVERFTRLDPETIRYRLTVSDPATFSRPWTLENALRKSAGPMYEVACHEGNYGLAGILSGARAEENRTTR
jgi:hypothetical protein